MNDLSASPEALVAGMVQVHRLPEHRSARAIVGLTPAECAAAPPRGYIVKGLIAPGDVGIVYGPPGSGKSVLVPHLAYAVAQGRNVFGRRVKQRRVLYFAAEDGHGMRARIAALMQEHGDAPDFLLVIEPLDLMNPDDRTRLKQASIAHDAGLVVIDTIARAFEGLRENDTGPEGMGAVVSCLRVLATDGRAVVAVHHAPKGGDTPRGHGGFNGDADMTLHLEGEPGAGTRATVKKNRNGESGQALGFTIRATELGRDEDGDPITAPVLDEVDGPVGRKPRKLSPQVRQGFAILHDTITARGAPLPNLDGFPTSNLRGCRVEEWRRECTARALAGSDDDETRKRVFRRVRTELTNAGLIAERDGLVWAVPGG
jgi:hypothetical protein